MATTKELKKAANELVSVMLLDEKLDDAAPYEEAFAFMKEAVELINWETDHFSDETMRIIREFMAENGEDEEIAADKKDLLPEVDEKEALRTAIKDAKKRGDLTHVARYHASFEVIRRDLSKYQDLEKLRKMMLRVLDGKYTPKEDDPESEIAPEALPEPPVSTKKERVRVDAYSRFDAVCEALKHKNPKTVRTWIDLTDKLFVENGGKSNPHMSYRYVLYAVKILKHFDIKFPKERW